MLSRLRRLVRTPLCVPLVLATALAGAGHLAASRADAPARVPVVLAAPWSEALNPAVDAPSHLSAFRVAPPRRRAERATRALRAGDWVRPAGGPLTSVFGPRWGRAHEGIDLGAPFGSPVRAVADAVIVQSGPFGGYGNFILLRHKDGLVTAYGHMSKLKVFRGTVKRGQVIGLVGNTGHSTGTHLHFEVRRGETPLDPRPILRTHGVTI